MAADIVGDLYGDDYSGADMGVMGPDIIGDEMFSGDRDLDELLAMGADPPAAAAVLARARRGAMQRGARGSHAAPAPGRKFQVREVSRGVWREQYVPLNLAGGVLSTIAAGATVIVSTTLQKKFRANRMVIDSGVAGGYVINDIRVGVTPQLAATGSLPGRMFTELAVGIGLHADTGEPGIQLSVSVTNVTGGALPFVAGFQGIAVE
jgi:hypothetical protein